MKNRIDYYTKAASYEEREKIWRDTIEATEKHIKLESTLQGQGIEILTNIQGQENIDIEKVSKLIQQATATIEKGVKIEREAREKLAELHRQQPQKR